MIRVNAQNSDTQAKEEHKGDSHSRPGGRDPGQREQAAKALEVGTARLLDEQKRCQR